MIDRAGKHFGCILNFLRDGTSCLPDSRQELEELLAEAKFYLIEELVKQCEEALRKKGDSLLQCCIVRLATSAKQEKILVNQSDKVVKFYTCFYWIKFLYLHEFMLLQYDYFISSKLPLLNILFLACGEVFIQQIKQQIFLYKVMRCKY